jgi:hypothetical protein
VFQLFITLPLYDYCFKTVVFWDVTLYSLVDRYQSSRPHEYKIAYICFVSFKCINLDILNF